ncbi:MAG: hypothetical protein KGL39_24225 [Patescibacteria group bacterium]|nr:hypothetical protein [Patescibacteria group bacterium]
MGFLSIYDKTERISLNDLDGDLDGDYWIDIKPNISTRGEEAAYNVLMQAPRWKSGEVEARAQFPEYRREIAFWTVTGWNLTDAEGREIPLPTLEEAQRNNRAATARREALLLLPGYALNAIVDHVNAVNERRSGQEKVTFRSTSDGGPETGA